MGEVYNTILDSLSNGGYLETDGVFHWWVNDGEYNVIDKEIFMEFIKHKIVYGKRIDDDTTCYYIYPKKMLIK